MELGARPTSLNFTPLCQNCGVGKCGLGGTDCKLCYLMKFAICTPDVFICNAQCFGVNPGETGGPGRSVELGAPPASTGCHFQELPMVQTAFWRDSKITQRQSWLYQPPIPSHRNYAFLRDLSTVAHPSLREYGEYGRWCASSGTSTSSRSTKTMVLNEFVTRFNVNVVS